MAKPYEFALDLHVLFPAPEHRCEQCGYPLVNLTISQNCPECGLPLRDSDPARRTGLAWQRKRTLGSWLATIKSVLTQPRPTYRAMRLNGVNLPDRLFLLSMITLAGVVFGVGRGLSPRVDVLEAWLLGMAAAKVALVMTYIEVLGVAYFSRRRGWPLGLKRAERVAAYASVGWPGATLAFVTMFRVIDSGTVRTWLMARISPQWFNSAMQILVVLALGLALLAFEWLVWTGVRQVRYGNAVSLEKSNS